MGKPKIGRNDPCPCGSGRKFKVCCEGHIDWAQLIEAGADPIPHLSVRGRNLLFLRQIVEALQLDSLDGAPTLDHFKGAFTAEAVRKIHEGLMLAWPQNTDLAVALRPPEGEVSGLYVGDYEPRYIINGLVRHSLYTDKLLVVDPFMYPATVRDEYNPILNPKQHRAQTLANVNLWFAMAPWIEAGLIGVIRTPADFDTELYQAAIERQRRKFAEHKELRDAVHETNRELRRRHGEYMKLRDLVMMAPDEILRRMHAEANIPKGRMSAEEFIAVIEGLRASDPNFLEPLTMGDTDGQIRAFSTGANYDIAAMTSSLSGSYLVTDLYARWKEIEFDREHSTTHTNVWSPLAKAFQDVKWKCLDGLTLDHALVFRQEGRLEGMRTFLRRIWKAVSTTLEPYSDVNAYLLGEELKGQAALAEEEWKGIHRQLLHRFGAQVAGEAITAAPLIASGHGGLVAAATLVSTGSTVLETWYKRKGFPRKHPAAFFLRL